MGVKLTLTLFNSTPQNKQDYSPKPARKTGDEVARELFGISKGPAMKWEPNNRGKPQKHRKPQMSQEELNRHYAEGLCLNCHKPGHKARECPN